MCENTKLTKAKAVKAKVEEKIAMLEKPLSELTELEGHLPSVDIEAYVNRSAEGRREDVETGKVPGKVKRPLNSFMLYRKAYQGRVKEWYLQKNPRIVSQLCGTSWFLEPEHIKEQYREWARIERINHQNAHPGYVFSPLQPRESKRYRTKDSKESVTRDTNLKSLEAWKSSKAGLNNHQPLPKMLQQPLPCNNTESANEYITSRG